MDPEMMKMAMDAMSKMSPQQMAAMQQQMASMPQSVLQEQMRNIQNMTPEQKRMASQQAKNFDPSQLPSQAGQYAASAGHGAFAEANRLKKEGNRLHGLGQYNSAVAQYEAASQKLQGVSTREAVALVTACKLNMASCFLNTGMYQKCIQQCSEVLRGDSGSLKAFFRRGQAHLALKAYGPAKTDLKKALDLASPDEKGMIQAILDKAQSGDQNQAADKGVGSKTVPVQQATATEEPTAVEEPAGVEEPASPTRRQSMDGDIEEIDVRAEAINREAPPPQPSTSQQAFPQGGMPGMEEMMRNPEMMRSMQSMMANMKPEDVAAMQRQAASFSPASGAPQHEQMAAMMRDPGTMKMMQNVMANMKPEDMQAMQRQAASFSAGSSQQDQMANMMKDPAMMQSMQNMMKNMKPEDMQALQQQAASLQAGGGSQAEQMQAMMNDPASMKAMQNMMSNMSASDLASMYKQAGVNISDEQAEKVAATMQSMSPQQMAKLMAAANFMQRALAFAKQYKALLISLVILFIGVLWKLWH